MNVVSNLSVKHKLALIISLFLILICAFQYINLSDMRKHLDHSKVAQSKQIVASAKSVASYFYQQSARGEITEEEAMRSALAIITNIRYGEKNYLFISNLAAVMIAHPIKPELNGKNMSNIRDENGIKIFVEFANIVREQGQGTLNYFWPKPGNNDAVEKTSYVNLFEQWNWIIGTGTYIDDIDAIYNAILQRTIILLALTLPIILIVASIISKSLTGPIATISQAMQQLAKGDFTVQVDYRADNEIGSLAASLNMTTQSLSMLIRQVGDSCTLIKKATESAAVTTVQTFDGLNRQRGQTSELAAAIKQMSANTQEIAIRAVDTAENSRNADNAAQQGVKIVTTTIGKIDKVTEQMHKILSLMDQLEQDTEQVESILNVISEISDQTNLLALNAAIEAARAGEQGRGFAVVADEVRNLAKRTQDSTHQIRELNERLKASFSKAVSLVKTGHEYTEQCTISAHDASDHINSISGMVNNILQMSDQVASSIEQQSTVAEEINQNIASISSIAEETSQGASETAQYSKTLSSMSQQLESRISEFKIS